MYKQYRYKNYVRIGFYLLAALIIGYYISDSYKICTELTDKELLSEITVNKIPELNYLHTQSQEIDLNITTGGALWNLFINTLQIMFLVMFMLILYINELIEKWYLRN